MTAVAEICFCISTKGRVHELERLLDDLDRLTVPAGYRLRVVVADNDPQHSARPLLARRQSICRHVLEFDQEQKAGIAAARNRTLELAVGDRVPEWLAFLDDDESVPEDWLELMVACASTYEADMVTGPVLPVLPPTTPNWMVKGGWFERRRLRTGAVVSWASTANLLIRRACLPQSPEQWFDDRFGATGGSDLELTTRLVRSGCRIVWCDEAHVLETFPPERVRAGWLVRRGLRVGNGTGRLTAERRGRALTLAYAGFLLLQSLVRVPRDLLRKRVVTKDALWPVLNAVGVVAAAAGFVVSEYEPPLFRRDR